MPTINFKGIDIPIEITSYSAEIPAVTNRLPEDCYESEPAEVDFNFDWDEMRKTELAKLVELLILENYEYEDEIEDLAMEVAEQDAINFHDAMCEQRADDLKERNGF